VPLSLRFTTSAGTILPHTPDNDSADMPAIYRSIDRPSPTLDLLSSPDACTVLLPEQTAVSPADVVPLLLLPAAVPIRPLLLCLQRSINNCCPACSVPPTTAAPACSMNQYLAALLPCLQHYNRLLLLLPAVLLLTPAALPAAYRQLLLHLQHNDNCMGGGQTPMTKA